MSEYEIPKGPDTKNSAHASKARIRFYLLLGCVFLVNTGLLWAVQNGWLGH